MRLNRFLLNEDPETFRSDINEIMIGYYALGRTWRGYTDAGYVKRQLEIRKKEILGISKWGQPAIDDEYGRAENMAAAFLNWAQAHGYSGRVKKVWWTARKGSLKKAVKDNITESNPTDTLFQFTDGKFLGSSGKGTSGKKDITFKNPGPKKIYTHFGMDINDIWKKYEKIIMERFEGIPKVKKRRSDFWKENPEILIQGTELGHMMFAEVRDKLLNRLLKEDEKKLIKFLLNEWLDASEALYPPYIKVTGHGSNGKFHTTIVNPFKDEKITAIMNGDISFEPSGQASIGISAGNKRVMKWRVKFNSGPFSTLKSVVDPW